MKIIDCLRSIQVSPRTAVLSIGLLAVLCAGAVVTARNRAASLPEKPSVNAKEVFAAAAAKAESTNSAAASKKTEPAASKANPDSTAQKPKEQKEKGPYDVIKERNLFRPLGSTGSLKAPAGGAKPSGPVAPMPVQPIPPLPPGGGGAPGAGDFKKSIAFTGVVETPSGVQALVENLQSKETKFVSKGESAFGCRVVGISAQILSLEKDGAQFTLGIGENKPDTEAAPAKPSGDQKQPQQESGRPGGPGGPPK